MSSDKLTEEEVQTLPAGLRICFHLQAWTRSRAPKSLEEWAAEVGWLAYYRNADETSVEEDKAAAVKRAASAARELFNLFYEIQQRNEASR